MKLRPRATRGAIADPTCGSLVDCAAELLHKSAPRYVDFPRDRSTRW